MLSWTKVALSAAIVFGTASAASASDQDLTSLLETSGRVLGQQRVMAPYTYAMLSRTIHVRRSTAEYGIRPNLADRQSAWYRL